LYCCSTNIRTGASSDAAVVSAGASKGLNYQNQGTEDDENNYHHIPFACFSE